MRCAHYSKHQPKGSMVGLVMVQNTDVHSSLSLSLASSFLSHLNVQHINIHSTSLVR